MSLDNQYKLPHAYVLNKFYQYAGGPKYKRGQHIYYGSCPVCREGKSWLKKKRLYYLVDNENLYCQNCNRGWTPYNWVKTVCDLDYDQIMEEAREYDDSIDDIIKRKTSEEKPQTSTHSLPHDCINLSDVSQVEFFKEERIVKCALNYISDRRLDTAINRPKAFYLSLTDFVHKNRLVIPFHNEYGDIIFYQTRKLLVEDDRPKYLSKVNADKSVFGIDRIEPELDYIFKFEGPIDAMFVKNGISLAGLSETDLQTRQLKHFPFHKQVWVLDNPFTDDAAREKAVDLIKAGETVFVPPEKFREFKDLNDMCIYIGIDNVKPEFFIKNSFSGMKATLALGV